MTSWECHVSLTLTWYRKEITLSYWLVLWSSCVTLWSSLLGRTVLIYLFNIIASSCMNMRMLLVVTAESRDKNLTECIKMTHKIVVVDAHLPLSPPWSPLWSNLAGESVVEIVLPSTWSSWPLPSPYYWHHIPEYQNLPPDMCHPNMFIINDDISSCTDGDLNFPRKIEEIHGIFTFSVLSPPSHPLEGVKVTSFVLILTLCISGLSNSSRAFLGLLSLLGSTTSTIFLTWSTSTNLPGCSMKFQLKFHEISVRFRWNAYLTGGPWVRMICGLSHTAGSCIQQVSCQSCQTVILTPLSTTRHTWKRILFSISYMCHWGGFGTTEVPTIWTPILTHTQSRGTTTSQYV